ncbi:acetyl-CoA carboxylase biotin carboxyl carrier protein subunit [Flavivirga amylovorans]|uniref:Acetyl-CoA carboxylase biotin carboxyl carrier protein subunit n=1 Tax=Flavivirga amylovorans TaxID=870486 RepID=A0ABT8X4Y0_9FLAO|nr:acetyl-CoA carboxylase biotin carboxyl carrier protein subunit [Flavivirga amylovorans]MDO5988733.1 acetyl-CoA carboxylase biotin carboxyl carrier protein subunit [Flavivirga amylovorans]
MSKTFKTSVNNTFDFEIKDDDISNLNALQISASKFHVLDQNKSYHAEITRDDFNKKSYEVKINNNTYNINILNDLDVLIKDMGFSIGAAKHIDSVKAPMPGLILEINVKANQEVKEDDPLLILEAMKMENIITSPTDGVIKSISVSKGEAVEKNQLLIEFDS